MFTWSNLSAKIAQRVSLWSNDAFFALGWRQMRSVLSGPGQRILVYHGLDQRGETTLNGRFLSAVRFEEQVRFLSENTQIVALSDYFSGNFDQNRFAVAITFDDGHRNNRQYAVPILDKYAAPATFFLTSAAGRGAEWLWMDFLDVATQQAPATIEVDGRRFTQKTWRHTRFFVDQEGRKLVDWARYSPWPFVQAMETALLNAGAWNGAEHWATYWQLLAPADIREMADNARFTIGAHGHTHQDLARLAPEQARLELAACRDFLQKTTGRPVSALAYPFGTYTRDLVESAAEMGFSQQLALDFSFPEDHTDHRLRERMCMNPFISDANQWLAVQKGRY
jgi:peptidoglycan/xylan/chitin deacetylase (PgdA/CDA1 family)